MSFIPFPLGRGKRGRVLRRTHNPLPFPRPKGEGDQYDLIKRRQERDVCGLAMCRAAEDFGKDSPLVDHFRTKDNDQSTVSECGCTHYHFFAVAEVKGGLHLRAIVQRRGGQSCRERELTDLNNRRTC
jgi:hypothetical protein